MIEKENNSDENTFDAAAQAQQKKNEPITSVDNNTMHKELICWEMRV